MKRINKFENLSHEDRQFILHLCAENPYHDAVPILAKPRPEGGLNLQTSRSALSRFCVHYHPEQRSLEVLGQYADAVRIKGQAHLAAAYEATLTLVQARILESLRSGKAVADLEREFRSLERLQRCLRAEEERRSGRWVDVAYREHTKELAATPETDFTPLDENEVPGSDAPDLALDIDEQIPGLNDSPDPLPTASQPSRPANPAKNPDFPHFPPDPTSETTENLPVPEPGSLSPPNGIGTGERKSLRSIASKLGAHPVPAPIQASSLLHGSHRERPDAHLSLNARHDEIRSVFGS